jgi:phosphoribosylaminoimidazole carboxylase PurK protein
MTYDLGFLGGGQLARMSIQAAQRMGLTCLSLDPGEVTPASQIAPSVQGSLSDPEAIARIFAQSERVTLENEFIAARCIEEALRLAQRPEESMLPGLKTLSVIQDKLLQRQAFARHGVPSPNAKAIGADVEPDDYPAVLKARFGGYDGKGTRYVKDYGEFEALRPLWSPGGWLVEQFVPFKRELAVMVVSTNRGCDAFPTVETVQRNYVCDLVFPANCDASETAIAAVKAVEGYGIFGVELFELEDGSTLVNEIAPRPHNTGHYTLDWGGPSQFEAHIRAVTGLPAPMIRSDSFAVMVNLLGTERPFDYRLGIAAALEVPGAFVHWYGKSESRAGRKMGHINVVGASTEEVDLVIQRALEAREKFFEATAVSR